MGDIDIYIIGIMRATAIFDLLLNRSKRGKKKRKNKKTKNKTKKKKGKKEKREKLFYYLAKPSCPGASCFLIF